MKLSVGGNVVTCPRCGEELVENTLHICDELVPLMRLASSPAPPRAGGLERIVVGYRAGDRRVLENRELYGLEPRVVRQCYAGCGYPVYFYSGGVDAVSDRDAEVVCVECKTLYYPDLIAAL